MGLARISTVKYNGFFTAFSRISTAWQTWLTNCIFTASRPNAGELLRTWALDSHRRRRPEKASKLWQRGEVTALSTSKSRPVVQVAHKLHLGSSRLKIATFQCKFGTRSTLWQLHLETRKQPFSTSAGREVMCKTLSFLLHCFLVSYQFAAQQPVTNHRYQFVKLLFVSQRAVPVLDTRNL